jgi:sugar porter (SP) family MFS transporter
MSDKESDTVDHIETIDLNENIAAKIRNPLHGISRANLLRNVETFAKEKDLMEILPALNKGAILAQNPNNYENLDVLDDTDRAIIRNEHEHRWSHPMTLYITVILCSLGAATQGWDQTGSNGANLSFPVAFGIPDDTGDDQDLHSWLIGIVNAAPYIGAAVCGCWLSDPLNNFFGRRGTIFITALILIITPIGSGFTQNWQQLFGVRFILGIGMGAKGSTVPIFAAENSPANIRGALVMGWQLWTAFGIFLGFAANVIVEDAGPIAWRLQFGSAFIPAVPLALGILFCPESPRWLMKKNRYAKAYKSLCRLRHSELQAARDLYYIHVQLVEEAKIIHGSNYFKRFAELFTIPRVRRATVASGVVMLAQQMCGINIIAFYSSTIFSLSGSSPRQALYASLGFGAINFTFAIPALFTIDTYGRRTLLLSTFPNMAWSLLAAGLCFLIPGTGTTRLGLIALFIYIFAAFYSVGEGPVPFAYSAEVFPLAQREQGMAWAVTVCLGFAAILTITFPRLVTALTATGAFGFYAGLNITAFVLIFLYVPETKQRTLEELDQVFSVPSRVFIKYQTQKALPYWIKRWVLFNKNASLEPLYNIETDDSPRDMSKEHLKVSEKSDV